MARLPCPGRPDSPSINKLVVVVTDACNLRCRYCYARLNGGAPSAATMTPATARAIIRRFLGGRARCTLVQFFGGEPTLNLGAVEAAIEETLELVKTGELGNRPRFAIVTNGVIPDWPHALYLLGRHEVETTVSLDGPASLHDTLRPHAARRSTYAQAAQTVSRLLEARLPVAIESVYTSLHVKAGFSVVDLFHFADGLGVPKLIFDTAYPPAPPALNPLLDPFFEPLVAYYLEAVDWWCDSLLKGKKGTVRVYFRDLLLPLLEGVPAVAAAGGCGAAHADFAVGPQGDLFPCQLLYGQPEYRLGNVVTGRYPGLAAAFPTDAEDVESCARCFARHWCQPCAALNRCWGDAWQPPERECRLRRAVVQRIGRWAFEHLAVPENPVTSVLRDAVAD